MKSSVLSLLAFLCAVLSSGQAIAASTNWQDLGGGKARLLATLDPKSGKVEAALEVKLDEGWSTYWRYPGSSGIPPIFDFSGSNGFEIREISFPVPQLLGNSELRYAGYKNSVTFPISGTVFSGVRSDLHLDLLIGICAEVCIPAKAEMKITADELLQSDPLANQVVTFSKLTLPTSKDAREVIMKHDADGNKLTLEVKHRKSSAKPSLFVEGPSSWYLEPATLVDQTDETATFTLDVSRAPKGTDISSERLRYTLANGSRGVEFVR